jgi:hypothetical protein
LFLNEVIAPEHGCRTIGSQIGLWKPSANPEALRLPGTDFSEIK